MLRSTTRESVMILMIIATAVLFSYMLSSLYITQTLAQAIADANFNPWTLMLMINLFLLVAGCFIPPAGIILMTAPSLLPIITNAGFDPVWFGVIMTINMEIGLITPPVGLNVFVINSLARDVPMIDTYRGVIPFLASDFVRVTLIVTLPILSLWLPNLLN
jgi:TRAP-type C4-dicarboxylate transport system permease large subunit